MKYRLLSILFFVASACCLNVSAQTDQPTFHEAKPDMLFVMNGTESREGLNIQYFDRSRLQAEYLSILQQRNQRAYETLHSALENLHAEFIVTGNTVLALQSLADEGLTNPPPVQNFLAAVRHYELDVITLQNRINSLVLSPELLSDDQSGLTTQINFSLLKQHYASELEKLKHTVASIHFRLALPSGVWHEQIGLDISALRQMTLYTEQQISEMRNKIRKLKTVPTIERQVIDQGINTFTKTALETYIDVFGTSERYRTSYDPVGMQKAAEALKEVFWARSYIRAVYGIKIGSLPVLYQKHIFNLDYYLSSVSIGPAAIYAESKLVEAANTATEALATLHDIDATPFSASLKHIQTWITGSTRAINAKRFIITLVWQDLDEELELGKYGGLKKIRASYRERYYQTPKEKNDTKKKERHIFPDTDDPEADLDVVDQSTLRGVIRSCQSSLAIVEDRLYQARQLEDTLEAITRNNTVTKNRKIRQEL